MGNIYVSDLTNSKSIYHSGVAEIERRFGRGIGVRFNYRFSKSIDNTSDSNVDRNGFGNFGCTR